MSDARMRAANRGSRKPPVGDVVLAVALWTIGILEIALGVHPRVWPDVVIGAVIALPLAVRRTMPLLGALGITAGLVVLTVSGGKSSQYTFVIVSALIALYSLGAYGGSRERVAGLVIGAAAAIVSATLEKGHGLSDAIFAAGVVAVPWTVGVISHRRERATAALRDRAERLEIEQAERERAAIAAERDRIARELHDIVAHAVTLMVLQANAGDRQLDGDPAAAHEAFGVIRESGKSALAELRRMLDLLHSDIPLDTVVPQPSLNDVEDLVDRSRRAGMRVTLQLGQCGEVPESVAVAVYRLIQEALTNANRHAHGAPVAVLVGREDNSLRVRVQNEAGDSLPDAPGSGHGLVGMRERVKVFGGSFAAAATADGGFNVDVRLPLERQP